MASSFLNFDKKMEVVGASKSELNSLKPIGLNTFIISQLQVIISGQV